jgi:SNF2 family DNA or RNA helicase
MSGIPRTLKELSVQQAASKGNSITTSQSADVKPAFTENLISATEKLAIALAAEKAQNQAQAKELDQIFESTKKEQMKNVPAIPMPKQFQVKLFEYQEEGVRWLAHRENDVNDVPPFWKQVQYGSVVKWRCSLTGKTHDKPAPVRGGILADGT